MMTAGFDFQHGASYSVVTIGLKRTGFALAAWDRETDGRTDRSIA